jgi:hypothetical protein
LEGKISKLPLDKENKLKEGHGRLTKGGLVFCVFFPGKKEENEGVKEKLVLMCERMLFMKKCVQPKSMERNYV